MTHFDWPLFMVMAAMIVPPAVIRLVVELRRR